MTVCGKPGKTMKLFSHPSHSPWKSLPRFPHSHRHDYDGDEYTFPKTGRLRGTHSEGKVISLTGNSFETDKIARNWGAYIKALNDAGADTKITGNLDHIRAEYRNPVMHPTVNVQPEEAFVLAGIGFSAITQVLNEIARIMSSLKTP